MARLCRHAVVQQEVPSDRFGKLPKEARLLKAVSVDAFFYHDLDGLLELVPARETLHVLNDHVARLWAGITGSRLHSKVQLPEVIIRWGIASLILSLLVGKVFT